MTPAQKSVRVITIKSYHSETPTAFCLYPEMLIAKFYAGSIFLVAR